MKLPLNDVSRALSLPRSTVERWIRQGRIPIRRSDQACEFIVAKLKVWAGKHNLEFILDPDPPEEDQARPLDNLCSAIERGGIFYQLKSGSVREALYEAAHKVPGLSNRRCDDLHNRLMEREAMASTGLGKGVAVPHPRSPLSHPLKNSSITVCFLEQPLDFGAIDDQAVFVFFLLLSPSVKCHLHLLSRLAYCLRDDEFVAFLRHQPDPEALFEHIDAIDTQLDKG
jgi:PTS system nitrogen regulatory IIA component